MKHINLSKLKSILPFWQEIVFLIPLGLLLIDMTMNFSKVINSSLSIFCLCLFLVLFVCLIGQLFWKNAVLGIYIAFILSICSIVMLLLFLAFLVKVTREDLNSIFVIVFGLTLFLGFLVTSVSMIVKHVKAA